ncbi:MAG: hypothetical protein AB1650_00510 [Candidatus Omnitrophota bacterium]
MKKLLILLILSGLLGCSYGKEHVELIFDNPGVLEDSLYAGYQKKLDEIERQYLRKEISYADYIRLKQELDDQYSAEQEKRTRIIEGNN